jgi:hypothetical protein
MEYNFIKNLKLKKYYNEPSSKYNLVSTALFRLKDNYRQMTKYHDLLLNLVNNFDKYFQNINGYEFYLRIYFDESLTKKSGNNIIDTEIDTLWLPLLRKLKKHSFIQLCKFKHKDFIEDNNIFHIGLFGTIIRFLPMFNFKFNDNIQLLVVSDVDLNDRYLDYTKSSYNYVINHDLQYFFRTSFCKGANGRHLASQNIANSWLRVMAGTMIINNYRFDKNLLNVFFGQIYNKNYGDDLLSFINLDKTVDLHKKKTASESIFKYGIDEYFASYFIKECYEKNVKFGYISTKDIDAPIFFYYIKHNDFVNEDHNPLHKQLLKELMKEKYIEKKTIRDNFNYYTLKITDLRHLDKMDNISKYFIKNTIELFEKIDKNPELNIYEFNKYEIKCVLFQKDKIYNDSDYYINN